MPVGLELVGWGWSVAVGAAEGVGWGRSVVDGAVGGLGLVGRGVSVRVWGWWVEVGQWCVLLGLGLVGWVWSVVVWVGGLRGLVGSAFGLGLRRSWFVLAGMAWV